MGAIHFSRCLSTSKKQLATPLHQRPRSKSSRHDDWWTPEWLFHCLCTIYNVTPLLDVCASYKNSKCYYYFDEQLDALKNDWKIEGEKCRSKRDNSTYIGGSMIVPVWCNPPNSKLGDFLLKAYEQYLKYGMRILMIVPTNTMSSNAFWDAVELPKDRGESVFYKPIYKRVEFLEHGEKPEFGARNAYLVVGWGFQKPLYHDCLATG